MNQGSAHAERHCGFTLIELAVVIFLLGLLTTAGVKLLSAQVESTTYAAVAKKQETVRQALIAYLGKFKRLPCPDTQAVPDGNESRVAPPAAPAACVANFGRVPYRTLGLPRETVLDGWESYISYAVSPAWTLTLTAAAPLPGIAQTNVAAAAFNLGNTGALTVNDRVPANNPVVTPLATPGAGNGAVVVLISHGRNASGAFTIAGTQITVPAGGTDEAENINGANTIYFKRDITDAVVPVFGAFDDIVMAISPGELLSPLIRDGVFKSGEAAVTEQLAMIRDAAIGRITAGCAIPASLALLSLVPLATVDAWGQPIQYAAAAPALASPLPPAGTVAFKLWSRGPNQIDDGESGTLTSCNTTTDNMCLAMTYDVLRARIPITTCP